VKRPKRKYECASAYKRDQGYGANLLGSLDNPDGLQEWSDRSNEIRALLLTESPRGAALIARAYTESLLDACLRKAERDKRRNYSRALRGGLGFKIETCLKDRLVPRSLATKLCCIKEVGDAFAHNHQIGTFMNPVVRAEMRRLQRSATNQRGGFTEKKGKFILIVAMQLVIINTGSLRNL